MTRVLDQRASAARDAFAKGAGRLRQRDSTNDDDGAARLACATKITLTIPIAVVCQRRLIPRQFVSEENGQQQQEQQDMKETWLVKEVANARAEIDNKTNLDKRGFERRKR